jgi:hypothetical protein
MESLDTMYELLLKMKVDAEKVIQKGNHSASIRARKNSQELKLLQSVFRKEILEIIKTHPKKDKDAD